MKYLIGEIVEDYAKKQGKPFRRYAIDCDMSDSEFAQIRKGIRAASGEKLSTLIELELLREPVINEITDILNTLDTNLIIDLYNLIYAKERGK